MANKIDLPNLAHVVGGAQTNKSTVQQMAGRPPRRPLHFYFYGQNTARASAIPSCIRTINHLHIQYRRRRPEFGTLVIAEIYVIDAIY